MLRPGQTIGILGGGQLGRMLALAAANLGLKVHIFAPEKDSPAFDVSARQTIARYDDEEQLARFAACVDVVTYEFENVPAKTAAFIEARRPLHPNSRALAITQDRFEEKSFLAKLAIKTAPFRRVDDLPSLEVALAEIGRPAVLKTRRFGYDGKGQVKIAANDDLESAWAAIGRQPAILEGFVGFSFEFSVLVGRDAAGNSSCWDICVNRHANHILAETIVPSEGGMSLLARKKAFAMARKIAEALDYRGVLAVEMFFCGNRRATTLIVNEIAPRVHNSGHWTIEGAETSQFEQHIRAIAGWPLGSTMRRGAEISMTNLIGREVETWPALLAEQGAYLHLYGKSEARPGRKMGHVTRIDPKRRSKRRK